MPQVDFTLKDVQKIVDSAVGSSEKRLIAHMDMRFHETHIATAELITTVNDHMDERFGVIDDRLDGVDERFNAIDAKFESIDHKLDGVDARFDGIDSRFDEISVSTAGIVSDVNDHFDQRFDKFGSDFGQLKRVVDQHSREIMDLKAKVA